MRIIKQGQIKNPETIVKCNKCDTKFGYDISDVKSDRDVSYVNCPVCGAFISTKAR